MPSLARAVRILALGAAALLAPARPTGAVEKPVSKVIPYEGWSGTLPTGLRLVTFQRPGVDRAAVGVSWVAGSVDDPPGKEGLAHVVEHLAFRARSGGGTVWQRLQADGVAFNAFTEHDATTYFEVGSTDQLPLLLAVEADRMRGPLAGVTEADVEAEKAIVTSELRQGDLFAPWLKGLELLESRLYPAGHPYHRSIGGTPETVGSITMADVQSFVAKHYTADRAIVVVLGAAPPKQLADRALLALGAFATGEAMLGLGFGKPESFTRPSPPMPPKPPPDLVEVTGPVDRPVLLVGFTVPGEASGQLAMAEAAADNLRSSLSSRLFKLDLFEDVQGVEAVVIPRDGPALVLAAIGLQPKADAARILRAVRDRLADRSNDDLGEVEAERRELKNAQRSRDSMLVQAYLDAEQMNVWTLTRSIRASGKSDALQWRQRQIVEVNKGTRSYAYQHLARERSAAVLVRPDPAVVAQLDAGGAAGLADRMAERHDQGAAPFTPTRTVAQVARPPGLDGAVRSRLPSGLELVVARRGTLPFAEVRLVMRTEPTGPGGRPVLLPLAALLHHGTAADERWNHGAFVGAQSDVRLAPDSVIYRTRGASGNLAQLLEDAARWPTSFTVDRAGFELSTRWLRRELEVQVTNPEARGASALFRQLYPDHPYGRLPGPADLEALTRADVERFIETQLRPDRATLVVVGDVVPEEVAATAARAFGRWKAPAPPVAEVAPAAAAPVAPPPMPAAQKVLVVDRPGARLALVLLGLRLPGGATRDDPAAQALAWRLESTLMDTLRVEAGVTYGVHVIPDEGAQARSLVVQTAVDTAVTGEAFGRLFAALEGLGQVPLPPEPFARARWQVARRHARSFDTVAGASGALQRLALEGLAPDHYEKQAASIAALDPARVQALAKALVGREVAVVVGDAKVVLKQLEDQGFSPELVKP